MTARLLRSAARLLLLTAALCALSLEPAHARPVADNPDASYVGPTWGALFAGKTAHDLSGTVR